MSPRRTRRSGRYNSVKSLSLYSLFGALGAAAAIIFLIMVMIVRERKQEVGILKAVGGSNSHIAYQFMTEALTFSVLGGAAGLVAGALTQARYVQPGQQQRQRQLDGKPVRHAEPGARTPLSGARDGQRA